MKKNYFAISSIIFFFYCAFIFVGCGNKENKTEGNSTDLKGTISLSGAFAVYPLAVQWGEEFKKLHPEVRFDVQGGGAGKGIADVLSGSVDIGMVSRAINEEETKNGAYPIAIAKDAVVPTISAKNPYVAVLQKKGVTKEQFIAIYMDGKNLSWSELAAGKPGKDKIEVFTRSDAAGAPETWAKYLGKKQEDLKGTGVFGDPGLAEAVMKNHLALGFNNINYVYDPKTRFTLDGILPLPIDVNGNGQIDDNEDFYESIDSLNTAVIQNRFPSPPARELYFVTKGKTTSPLVKEFLNWILTEGQKFVEKGGYVKLDDAILQKEKTKVN